MSRSRKRTPICGITTAISEKQNKRHYSRRYRRACKMLLRSHDLSELLPILKEFSDVWTMDKDGKNWFNAEHFPKYMRK